MALSKILPASRDQSVDAANLVLNGEMKIAQRGTSVTGLTSSSTYHTVDRWQFNMGSIGTFSISQSTTAPSGFSNSLKLSCTTANASPAAGAYLQLIHKIEGQNLQHLSKGTSDAQSVTLSFWCRCSKTGDFVIELRDGANSRHIGSLVTISASDTWEYKTITFAGDTTGTLANDNTTGFELDVWLAAGTNFTSGTLPSSWASSSNTNRAAGVFNLAASTDDFYITGVCLNVGDQAPANYPHRSYGEELALCKRYYVRYSDAHFMGRCNGTAVVDCYIHVPVQLRAVPSASSSLDTIQVERGSVTFNATALTGYGLDVVSQRIRASGSGGSDGQACWLRLTGNTWVEFDAEL